ncbi:MAG: PAS domain S-box-containing protein [Psychromonas sp.]|jgi:PAS domain S-box-containing protein|uniref:EAL domain-containing protein n=1 Tax=Psychromonas sp. TaxID=1884585 RepID=UPI0039E6CE06
MSMRTDTGSETKQVLTINDIPPFQWQLHLQSGELIGDAPLLNFLGYAKNSKLTLDSLFKVFKAEQVTQLKKMVKQTLVSQQSCTGTFVTTALKSRYLIEFYFDLDSQQASDLMMVGHLRLLKRFPQAAQIDEIMGLIFASTTSGMMLLDADHNMLMINKQYCSETGYLEHELLGKNIQVLKSDHYSDDFYNKLWSKVDNCKIWSGELLAKNRQDELYTNELKLRRLDLLCGDHYYYVESVKLDVSANLFTNYELPQSKQHLPDKQAFTEQLAESYNELSTNKTIVVAAFTVKSSHKINSSVMQWLIAQRFNITEHSAGLGLISDKIYCAYWVQNKDADKINILLQKTVKTLSQGDPHDLTESLNVKINMGVSVLAVDANSPVQLLTHSMQTLIANPCSDEGAIYYFDSRFSKRFNKKEILAKLLKEALKNDQIAVHYQPITDIRSMQICKFEALFRVELNTTLSYNTQELISIAEEHNWVSEIDRKVTKIALSALPLLQKHFHSLDIGMSINRSLANDRISKCCLEETIDILLDSGADLSKVTIELTESAFFENIEWQKMWVEKLQAHGVQVALDDFGTGYSTFSYLKDLAVNIIKIDKSFVTDLTLDSNEYSMIEMLTKLAHKMGGRVIAEGVETIDEFKLLSRANVDEIQGYIVSKPQPLEIILSASACPIQKELLKLIYQPPVTTVDCLMNREFSHISSDDRLFNARKLFNEQQQTYLLVINESQCIGVLNSADMLAALSPYLETEGEQKRDILTLEKRVHQVMNKEFPKISANSPVASLEPIFLQRPDAVVIVTNEQSKSCVGVVTIQELLKYKLVVKYDPLNDCEI